MTSEIKPVWRDGELWCDNGCPQNYYLPDSPYDRRCKLHGRINSWWCMPGVDRLRTDLEAAREENKKLREALEFYANPDAYFWLCDMIEDDGDEVSGRYSLGKRAREALKGGE